MSTSRIRALVASGGLATLATVTVFALSGGSTPATAADRGAGDRASALATAADLDGFDAVRRYAPGREAAGRAAERSGAVPLPDGQQFDNINWANGPLTDADIEGLLEFNAACRWWIADDEAPSPDTRKVVASIPGWPTMRGGDRHGVALAFVSARDGELRGQVLAYCRHELGR